MIYNKANQTFTVIAFDDNGRVSGEAANITCTLQIDTGVRGPLNDTNPVEIAATGVYDFDLLQLETKGHCLKFIPECGTPGVDVIGSPHNVIYTDLSDLEPGSITWVVEIRNINGDLIPGAEAWVSIDEAGNELRTGREIANDFGLVTFKLDVGIYYLHQDHALHSFPSALEMEVTNS